MITRDEFELAIKKVDETLAANGTPPFQRPIQALIDLRKELEFSNKAPLVPDTSCSSEDFSGACFFTQVVNWYESRYGEKLKVHLGPGSYPIEVRGEPWEAVMPLCYGEINFYIDATTQPARSPKELNILSTLEDFPDSVAKDLTDKERREIMEDYSYGLNLIQSLKDLHPNELMLKAASDYDAAVECLFRQNPDYGNVKWSCLQFTEKTIKSRLKQQGVNFKFTHDLSELNKKLGSVGLECDDDDLQNIQCTAGVRYGEETVTRDQALDGLYASLRVFSHLYNPTSYQYNFQE